MLGRNLGRCLSRGWTRRTATSSQIVNVSSAPFQDVKCTTASVLEDGKRVQVGFSDGSAFELHGLWLRDACRDSLLVSEAAGEKYLDRTAFKTIGAHADGKVRTVGVADGGLEVSWASEDAMQGVRSNFPSGFLRMFAPVAGKVIKGDGHHKSKEDFTWLEPYSGFPGAPAPLKKLWKNQGVTDQFEHRDFQAVTASDSANLEMLQALMRNGVMILDNVTATKEANVLFKFASDCLGGMQKDPARDEPNWVIQKKASAQSVSYAQEKRLNNHTDQSIPAHGIPALLLAVHYVSGTGCNTLVDGYAVAEAMKQYHPEAFHLLSTYGNPQERDYVRSRVDSTQEGTQSMLISTKQPIIQTDSNGGIVRIQYNEVFRTPSTVPFDKFEAWYEAYLLWNDMTHGPEFEVEVPVGHGQMLILDNWRVLHGRAGRKSSPDRIIMGGTVVREAFHSQVTRLMRAQYPVNDYASTVDGQHPVL